MSWRTVVITNRCKLDLKMGYMVIRGEETKRIFLDEVAILLIENSAVAMTGCLLAELTEKKIKVIFCDGKRNPTAELIPYYGSYDCSRKIRQQVAWSQEIKGTVWTEIVSEKIRKQAQFLADIGKDNESLMLRKYLLDISWNDENNREGHAAKVYFNALFGMEFTRSAENATNAALNYGYTLILSAFNREIAANGYLTQMGIFHDNMFNYFNLSCDFMEPFRVLVDRNVKGGNYTVFEKEVKYSLLSVLNECVEIDFSNQTVLNAIKIYTRSVFAALNDNDPSLIRFPKI